MKAPRIITGVWIIYNPNSTGDSKKRALAFADLLKKHGISSTCVPTERAAHAEILAKQFAEQHPNCAIFSSSGDGGYNEVINGALQASSSNVICGVLPAGNANDHYHALHRGNTVKRIKEGDIDVIDCIEVQYGKHKRYAHSYVGLGLTPQIGEELTKRELSPLVEVVVVATELFRIAPVRINRNGRTRAYDHVVISNIPKMSKYITVAADASFTDGMLELTTVRSGSIMRLLRHLLRRVVKEDADPKRIKEYKFICRGPLSLQLDGEVVKLNKGQNVRVSCAPKILKTIV
jgi:diacylglycerol kinase (ATP)